jgi:hypothetical protein
VTLLNRGGRRASLRSHVVARSVLVVHDNLNHARCNSSALLSSVSDVRKGSWGWRRRRSQMSELLQHRRRRGRHRILVRSTSLAARVLIDAAYAALAVGPN